MSRKKLMKGALLTSLDQLVNCEWVIIRGKPYHRGWVSSWQLRMANRYVVNGMAYEGIRLTNGEYYQNLTPRQIFDRFGTKVCESCHLKIAPPSSCEGFYCDKALEFWKEELVS
jgi:hypothetical protein